MVEQAVELGRRGFRVFPCHTPTADGCSCAKRSCSSPGKHPRRDGWQREASCDETMIRAAWRGCPNANIGVATGQGLYVLDADTPAAIEYVKDTFGLDGTLRVRSGREGGGEHFYLRMPDGLTLGNAAGSTIAPGVDGRGDGGYVMAAGSLHPSGAHYEWVSRGV